MSEEKMTLCLYSRRRAILKGIKEVKSFDERGAELVSEDGEVAIEGEDIRIECLDKQSGEVEITGKINGVFYSEGREEKRRKLRGRLLG